MRESTGKNTKRVMPVGKTAKSVKGETKASEYVDCLLELHKLQGSLLVRLGGKVR